MYKGEGVAANFQCFGHRFGANLRIVMSSIMRRRNGLPEGLMG